LRSEAPIAPPYQVGTFDRIVLLVLLVVGVGLRLWIKPPTDLWEDEIIAVTHAVQPWTAVVVDSFRHDIHPPLYFLQLHLWSLFGDSDVWFMANSILWSFIGLASLFWVVTRHYGREAGLAATAAYAVMPSPVYMADQVRMYAMLATLIVWSLHFAISVFKERDDRWSLYAALILTQIAIILTHALGSIAVFCIGLYALQACREAAGGYRKWLICYGIAILVAVPCAINAALHEGGVAGSASIHGLMIMLGTSTVGIAAAINPVAILAGNVVFIVLIFIACRQKTTLLFLLFFTAVPLGLAFVGNAVQPFFKWNFFSTLQAPVIAIILGLAISRGDAVAKIAVACCLVVMLAVSIETRINFRESSRFLAVTKFLRENYQPGDVIFVPQAGYFHGLAWYLDGPRWGSPLKIAPPPSASWRKVYAKLGPNLVQRLELQPQTEIIDNKSFKLLTGTTPARDVPDAKRIWLVTADAADLPKGYPPPAIGVLRQQVVIGKHVQVSLYANYVQFLSGSRYEF
jgi:mannosyltransferase